MEPVCCATILTTSLITEKKGEKNSSYMFFIFWPARDQPMYTPLSFAIHYWNAVEVGSIVNHMQHDACDYFSDVFAGWGILKGTQYSLIENIRKYSVYEFSQKAWLELEIEQSIPVMWSLLKYWHIYLPLSDLLTMFVQHLTVRRDTHFQLHRTFKCPKAR